MYPHTVKATLFFPLHAGLTASEIDAIVAKLQQLAPQVLTGNKAAELRQELASLDVTLLGIDGDLSASERLDTLASRIFAGLTPPKGAAPGQPAPTPPGEP